MVAMAELEDGPLVELAKGGDIAAFNVLVERYQSAVYNLCRRLLGDRGAAEDATQEAFLSAYRALPRFEGGSLRSWLLRIAANQSKDELRRRGRRAKTDSLDRIIDTAGAPLEVPDPAPGAPELAERGELSRVVESALQELPPEQREALLLIDIHQVSYEEAATISGTSLGTVKSRVHRGRARLAGYLRAHPELLAGYRRLEG